MATLRSKLLASNLFVIVAATIIALTGMWGILQVTDSTATLMGSYVRSSDMLKDIDRDVREIRFRVAAVSLDQMPATGSANHLKEAREKIAANWKRYQEAAQPIPYPVEQRNDIAQIEKTLNELAPSIFDRIAAAYKADDKAALNTLLESDMPKIYSGIRKPMERLIPYQNEAVAAEQRHSAELSHRAIITSFSVLVLTAVALLTIGLLIARRMNQAIKALSADMSRMAAGDLSIRPDTRGNDEFAALARDLTAAVSHLRELVAVSKDAAVAVSQVAGVLTNEVGSIVSHAERQNNSISGLSSTMEEISQTARSVADLAADAETAAQSNAVSAVEGRSFMSANVGIADHTNATMEESITAVKRLLDATQAIGKLSASIRAIADQTNLLALNAAIEAARAGEQGRGFAVVADEVRKLAELTGNSTTDIATAIQDIHAETDRAIKVMESMEKQVSQLVNGSRSTNDALERIVRDAEQASDITQRIRGGASEQSAAVQAISSSVVSLSSTTENTLASLRVLQDTTHRLNELSTRLADASARISV